MLAERRGRPRHIGYVLKQFPRLSETFVLNEILGVEAAGLDVTVASLRPPTEGRFHPGVGHVQGFVHYLTGERQASDRLLRALQGLGFARVGDALDFVEAAHPESRRGRVLAQAVELATLVRAQSIDHLHAHFLTIAGHTAHLVAMLTGVPYTVTAHAKDIYRNGIDWTVARAVADAAHAIVTVCDANAAHLAHRLPDARVVRIYNGLGPQPPAVGLDGRDPHLLLAVGRLVEKKGFDLLLDAFAKLLVERPELRLVVVGDGDQRDCLVAQARRLGLETAVQFLGARAQPEVADLMREATLMVAPCRVGTDGNQDALPTVLIEALGAGLPVVTTPVAGIPEIVEHGRHGLLIPPDDVDALAAAVVGLLDDPVLRAEMGSAGPRRLAERFDRRTTIADLVEVFGGHMKEH